MRHRSGALLSLIRGFPVVGCGDEVAPAVLTADDALGAELRQNEPDRRPARAQLLGEMTLGQQPAAGAEVAGLDQSADRALHVLRLGAHATPRRLRVLLPGSHTIERT